MTQEKIDSINSWDWHLNGFSIDEYVRESI